MKISNESLEIILDLLEIKVNALQIHDKDDARELNKLRKCKQEFVIYREQIKTVPLQKEIKNNSSSQTIVLQNG